MNGDTKKPKEPSADVGAAKPKTASADISSTRPKNPPANLVPSDGYFLEIDGKIKLEYESSEDALKAGLELKKKYPHIQVVVYCAKERTRTLVKLPE